ncbi:MAG: rhomboid family intramembrane serine protease, partial [Calditrichaeota bacterium]
MNYSYRGERFRLGLGGTFTPGVKYLILINIGIFILQKIFGSTMTAYFGLVPESLLHKFAIWQLFTYMFLHGGILHIFINMLVLWMFGSDLEREWGTREFLKYYFICGIGAGLIQVIFNAWIFPGNRFIPVVGASGAIYGLLLAFALLFPNREIYLLLFFFLPVRIQAKYLAMIFAGIALFSGVFGADNG